MVVPRLFGVIGTIAKGVDKRFGAEGRTLLAQIMGEIGSEMGKSSKSRCPAEDFKTVGMFWGNMLTTIFGTEARAEAREDEVVFYFPECTFGLEDTSRELCEAMMAQAEKVIETLGPKLTMEIRKTVAVGDPECEVAIKPKG
jgi:hypothetical protein